MSSSGVTCLGPHFINPALRQADFCHGLLGDTALAESQRSAALEAYLKANIYYALAWFPGNYTAEEQSAYESQLDVYQKAGALFEVPLEVVDVPFRDGLLTTYVHRPVGVEKPPLVIWTGGSDQYKANHYQPAQDLLSHDLAVVTFDLPGFGESKAWPTDPLAPLSDMMMTHESAANSDIWLLGTSPHCAVSYWPVMIPQVAGWLVDRMNRQPEI